MRMSRWCAVFLVGFWIASTSGCKNLKDSEDSEAKSADGSAPVTSVPIFANKADLPDCQKEIEGGIAYVLKERSFYICEDKKWKFSSLKGEDGAPGAVISPLGDQWRKVWKKWVKSSAYIESMYVATNSARPCLGPRYESGSGYIVGKDLLVTNGHVVPKFIDDPSCGEMELKRVRVWYPEDSKGDTKHTSPHSVDGVVTRVDRSIEKEYDTLLLEVPTGDRAPMRLSKDGLSKNGIDGDGLKLNDDVLQIGFSGGTTFPHFATGKVTQMAATENRGGYGYLAQLVVDGLVKNGATVIEYDLISGSGSSGGAVLDLRGLVVGTNFAGNSKDADTEFGYAVPVNHVIELLAKERIWDVIPESQ